MNTIDYRAAGSAMNRYSSQVRDSLPDINIKTGENKNEKKFDMLSNQFRVDSRLAGNTR